MKNILSLLVLLFTINVLGQDTLKVAVKLDPPFTMKYDNGHYSGLCIDLLKGIDVPYKIVEASGTYDEIIDSLGNGTTKYDYFVAPTTITKDRIEKVEFSQPFYVTSTSIAYTDKAKPKFSIMTLLRPIFNLFLIVLALGVIFYLVERGKNESVDNGPLGILTGFYWASATMTTVGYGDIIPKSKTAVTLSTILMWVSMLLTAYMIAEIDNATETVKLSLGDLNKCKVGTVKGGFSAKFLSDNDIKYISYNSPTEAFDAMNDGTLDAFVYDTPTLKYLTSKDIYSSINLLDETFQQQTFGVAGGGANKLNGKILEYIASDEWEDVLNKYSLN